MAKHLFARQYQVLEDPKENTTLEQWLLDEEEKHTIAQRFHASARPLGEALNRASGVRDLSAQSWAGSSVGYWQGGHLRQMRRIQHR